MPQRILVVDDDPNALRLIGYALHREGFEVVAALSGQEALRLVTEQPIDLVILDIMMPQMDGYEVCRRLRENPNTARLPILMLTAKSQLEDKVRGFKVGADDYVTKPVLPAELMARVRALLARSSYLIQPLTKEKAKTLTFLGAKGGVGTTTLAVNVAITLAEGRKSIILADLHIANGAATLQLGLKPPSNLLPLLKEHDQRPASKTVTACLVTHPSGLKVFPAPSRLDTPDISLSAVQAQAILNELKAQADYLVVDLGSCLNAATLAVIAESDRVVIVTEADYLALELAQQTVDALARAETRGALVEIVMVNRTRSATVLSKTEAEQQLNSKLAGFIIPAPEMCFQANRNRIPIVIAQPGNLTVEQIRDLANHLVS